MPMNLLSIDLEEWFHLLDTSVIPPSRDWGDVPERVTKNSEILLDLLEQRNIKATFFVLGWIAENYPELVSRVAEAGHEIACHGHMHTLVYDQTRDQFRDDIKRARDVIGEVTGVAPIGYRAPGFSIRQDTLWALDVLLEEGFEYDSSLFPAPSSHGGLVDGPTLPALLSNGMKEFPVSTIDLVGSRLAYLGGGYLRLLPKHVIVPLARMQERSGRPLVLYLHPRDIDPGQPRLPLPRLRYFRTYVGLDGCLGKLEELLDQFDWHPFSEFDPAQLRRSEMPAAAERTRLPSQAKPAEAAKPASILFLTDNFVPESNAPATRTHEHARKWVEKGHSVTVVTCAPNFPFGRVYDGYRNRLFQREQIDGIEVIRVWSYMAPNKGFAKRILDYLSFMMSAIIMCIRLPRPDVVVATSPQFFTAVAGWIVSIYKRRPFVFELRDLWPESIAAVEAIRSKLLLRPLEMLAHFLYRRADLIVPVTRTFSEELQRLGIPESRIEIVTNGIELSATATKREISETRRIYGIPEDAFVAGYIGTVGMSHGLATIIAAARLTRDDPRLHYVIMGEGADKQEVLSQIERESLTNVTMIDGKPRAEAMEVVQSADVSLVLLKNTPVFETVIPSKIFEAMALRKPIVLGVRGEARRIVVDECESGIAFEPEDAPGMIECIRRLADDPDLVKTLGENGYRAVTERYLRPDLADRMMEAIESHCVPRGSHAWHPIE